MSGTVILVDGPRTKVCRLGQLPDEVSFAYPGSLLMR